MKKLLLLTICAFAFTVQSQAQAIADHALGVRLGAGNGFGTEVSYQQGLTENNRLELDLGWSSSNDYDAFKLVGLYQWVWNLEAGFNWYAGVGAGLGSTDTHQDNINEGFFALAAGNAGIEYNFNFPLLISLDFRPEIGVNYPDDLQFDLALGIRYQF